ncbi:MAG TPA: MFS transporter [Terriglobales bacterium]|nr:MFS transporter [Terriglobales bacterium]
MRSLLQKRSLRLVFLANVVSMIGSGMNSAAVIWYILQATHSEVALGTLVVLQTIPSMLLLPFGGVVIDREDRRRLIMLLDVVRGLLILAVAVLVFRNQVQLWHLYLMSVLVSAGFWMFWPTISALLQELTPESEYVNANTFIMAGVQGGWLIAGAAVGFLYNHIGLGGILLIDVLTYVASFLCYSAVRKGRHVIEKPPELIAELAHVDGVFARFVHEIRQSVRYLRQNRYVVLVGTSWSLFIGAMLTQNVVTAPLSERILHAGAYGYGWLNAGWGIGAFISVAYTANIVQKYGVRRSIAVSMFLLAASIYLAPFSHWLAIGVVLYAICGSARGVGGVALNSSLMEVVPKHFMGRVQNTFGLAAVGLQLTLGLVVGAVAHRYSLTAAFAIIGSLYFLAFLSSAWPFRSHECRLKHKRVLPLNNIATR